MIFLFQLLLSIDMQLTNKIQTPDGTILQSFHRHDYKTYFDLSSNETYMIDGGLDYRRGNVNIVPAKDLSITTDFPFKTIRQEFCWGTRGKDGKQPIRYIPVCNLETDHILAILETQHQIPLPVRNVFTSELLFRSDLIDTLANP